MLKYLHIHIIFCLILCYNPSTLKGYVEGGFYESNSKGSLVYEYMNV